MKVPTGSGKSLIVNHLGLEDGFLNGCEECFVGAKDSADYHKEMNSSHFERWWEDSVLMRLPTKSVVVIDNASYHSRQTEESRAPTTNWRKAQIQDWLRKKSSTFIEKTRSLFSYRSPSKSRLKRNVTWKKSLKDFAKFMEKTSRFSGFLLDTLSSTLSS